jgi:hypothetical protein
MGWSLGKILKTVVTGGANLIVDKLNTGTAKGTAAPTVTNSILDNIREYTESDAQLDEAYASLQQAQAQLASQQSIIKQYEHLIDQQQLNVQQPVPSVQTVSSVQPAAESGSNNNLLLIVVVVVVIAFILFNRK